MTSRDEIIAARTARRDAESTLVANVDRLRRAQRRLGELERLGVSAEPERLDVVRQVAQLTGSVTDGRRALLAAERALLGALVDFDAAISPIDAFADADPGVPAVLIPVRLETAFARGDAERAPQLLVRIYPDDIAVQTHEAALVDDEIETARRFWIAHHRAAAEPGLTDAERDSIRRGAWRTVAGEHGPGRAAWICNAMRPASLDVPTPADLDFPAPETATESWTRAPRSTVMPDRFVVTTYVGANATNQVVGNQVPDPLIVGPDPMAESDDPADTAPPAGPGLEWLFDFDHAVHNGMAVRIPLTEAEAEAGFDRVIAVGVKFSSTPDEAAELVGQALTEHRFGDDGAALIAQGTPTNNTERARSGYSSVEDDVDARYDLEFGDERFVPTPDRRDRRDGQIAADALGVHHAVMQRMNGADGTDQRESTSMTDALWPATLGYYVRDLLDVDAATQASVAEWFRGRVSGRGPVPALRIGAQPYGVLPTTDVARWKPEPSDDPFPTRLAELIAQGRSLWAEQLDKVTHLGGPGDPSEVLVDVLGRHATSIEQHRRRAAGPDYRSNWAEFTAQSFGDRFVRALIAAAAARLADDLGATIDDDPPLLFQLAFFNRSDPLSDPVVELLDEAEDERWSETLGLQRRYHLDGHPEPVNYIGWLLRAPAADIKAQRFFDASGERVPMPDALLYRWLRRAFLLAHHDAAVKIVGREDPDIEHALAVEHELVDIAERPTPTRWRLMELPVSAVDPDAPSELSIIDYLQTPAGLDRPETFDLRRVRDALADLESLPTARLERLFREHVDVCSYRLDAWMDSLATDRLIRMRSPRRPNATADPAGGMHLGAYGWLENVRPRSVGTPVPHDELPDDLRPDDASTTVVRRPDNAGFVHSPSLNHGVVAAVLRNAYLSSAGRDRPERMAVDLSSARIRTALSLIEGVGEGQQLGALLGYRFERGLIENHPTLGLAQHMPAFRDEFALVADSITPDTTGADAAGKQARQVLDGYALAERAVLAADPIPYPWGVAGLPAASTEAGRALHDEVDAVAAALDSVADLLLAEVVYQSVQGNQDRSGATLSALGSGATIQSPEIVRTPRSGVVVQHRVIVDVALGAAGWAVADTARSTAEPAVNAWLAERLGPPDRIRFIAEAAGPGTAATTDATMSIADLGVQPIDLVLGLGDELHVAVPGQDGSRDDTTILETRIAHRVRTNMAAAGIAQPDTVTLRFFDRDAAWPNDAVTIADLLPVISGCRQVIASRAMTAVDLRSAGESDAAASTDPNPQGIDLTDLTLRVDQAVASLTSARDALVAAAPLLSGVPTDSDADAVRTALIAVADHALASAFPHSAVGADTAAIALLTEQAATVIRRLAPILDQATELRARVGTATVAADAAVLTELARLVLGDGFPLLPRVAAKNPDELDHARSLRPADPIEIEEWWLGLAAVHDAVAGFDRVRLLSELVGAEQVDIDVRQLPAVADAPWIAGPLDVHALPAGAHVHLAIARTPSAGAGAPAAGFVLEEWSETIPSQTETTGLAVHVHQPDSEPPQAILVAVPPRIDEGWSWDDLIGCVNDTLDRAKLRAVEPDHLASTALAHLLPAVVTAVATTPLATISMALFGAQELAISSRDEPAPEDPS
jgi:hypothetical protein